MAKKKEKDKVSKKKIVEKGRAKTKDTISDATLELRDITNILEESYVSYAINTMTRAIPFVNDGLNPVRRRILYVLLNYEKRLTKSARIVGDTIGQFHPHGDTSVYGTMVNMSQDFKMNYPLIVGQGNWGNIDGDGAAAMRYTECRLSQFAKDVYFNEGWETVDWKYNYDDTIYEPVCFSPAIPMILVNGSKGIVTGFANNIPPHNLREICDFTIAYLKDSKVKTKIREYILGPDFPTGGVIINTEEKFTESLKHGKGSFMVRPKYTVQDYKNGRYMIEITELPYGRDKVSMIDTFRDRYPNDEILRSIPNDGIIDLSTDEICLQLICKKTLSKEDAINLMEYMIKNGIFSSDVKYINNVVTYDQDTKLPLPTRMGITEIIDIWYSYRSTILKRYFDRKIAELEKAIEMNKYLQIFIKNYKKLAHVILDNDYRSALMIFKEYKINEDGFKYILGKSFASVQNKGDKILMEGEELGKELIQYNLKKQNIKKYIIAEVKRISDTYGRDRATVIKYRSPDRIIKNIVEKKTLVTIVKKEVGSGRKGVSKNTGRQITKSEAEKRPVREKVTKAKEKEEVKTQKRIRVRKNKK